jgi:hypothetical protein
MSEIMEVAKSRGQNSEAPHLWKGLVGAWTMQEGAGDTAYDVSGFGNHGTLTSMEPATDWVINSDAGFRFVDFSTDDNDRIELASSLVFANEWSFVAWYSVGTLVDDKCLAGGSNASGGSRIELRYSDRLRVIGVEGSPTGLSAELYDVMFTGTHQVALAMDGTNITCYNDGAYATVGASYPTSFELAELGNSAWSRTVNDGWQGSVGPTSVYSRLLQPSEIAQGYADPWAMYRRRPTQVAVISPTAPAVDTSKFLPLLGVG